MLNLLKSIIPVVFFLILTGCTNTNDQIWIQKLAKIYKVKGNDGQVTASYLDDLWKRVDVVPPSLALAQSAEESGWGTSRFAAAGNALYGQWSWGER